MTVTGHEEVLKMVREPDLQRAQAMCVGELKTNFQNKIHDAKGHHEKFNELLHNDLAVHVAEPALRWDRTQATSGYIT